MNLIKRAFLDTKGKVTLESGIIGQIDTRKSEINIWSNQEDIQIKAIISNRTKLKGTNVPNTVVLETFQDFLIKQKPKFTLELLAPRNHKKNTTEYFECLLFLEDCNCFKEITWDNEKMEKKILYHQKNRKIIVFFQGDEIKINGQKIIFTGNNLVIKDKGKKRNKRSNHI